MERVFDIESKRTDRRKAMSILVQAALIAGLAAALFVSLP